MGRTPLPSDSRRRRQVELPVPVAVQLIADHLQAPAASTPAPARSIFDDEPAPAAASSRARSMTDGAAAANRCPGSYLNGPFAIRNESFFPRSFPWTQMWTLCVLDCWEFCSQAATMICGAHERGIFNVAMIYRAFGKPPTHRSIGGGRTATQSAATPVVLAARPRSDESVSYVWHITGAHRERRLATAVINYVRSGAVTFFGFATYEGCP